MIVYGYINTVPRIKSIDFMLCMILIIGEYYVENTTLKNLSKGVNVLMNKRYGTKAWGFGFI